MWETGIRLVDEPDRPDDVSAMMEQLWGPRDPAPAGEPAVVAPRRDVSGPSDHSGGTRLPAECGDLRSVESRLDEVEARVERLQVALEKQAAQIDVALSRAKEASVTIAGVARITKIWTSRRKA